MSPTDFKTDNYFSWHVRVMAIGVLPVAIMLLEKSVLGSLALLFISVVIFTTHYRLSLDFSKKVYREYLWILGMKDGKPHRFDDLAYFFIKKNISSQTMGLKAATTTVVKEVYDAYLKFSNEEKLHITTTNHKHKLIDKLRPISKQLKIEILDYTEGEVNVIQ